MNTSASIVRNSVILGLFAIATVGSVSAIKLGTAERIAAAERHAQHQALNELIPSAQHDNDMLADTLPLGIDPLLGNTRASQGHRARQKQAVTAVILPVTAPDGYSGSIQLLVAINADGSLAGVRVVNHKETPGLGDKIEIAKSPWILSFNGKSLSAPAESGWAVRKDGGEFDAFAGATITPRAVVAAVHRALQYFQRERSTLLALTKEADRG
ncbi:electron transport complex subunit RsxG [Atopomonas sediminilitoris]|uniref:electron transport complex subunit RsxG n=1 Tax=Atopomonas sediminilitoris TaxID=2919919 RepID=UPI001F4E6C82|nr:electron transport complex subunit RsxG [Atopomonas sediminilitoris]MCJ8169696.1 electron transport complex subunit RsxG [Atopomonas sediminilitoris]